MCFATVLTPTATELKELIAYSSVPVVVEMSTNWSPPGQLLHPFLRKFAIDFADSAHVATIDVDVHRELRLEWDVRSVPQILVFRHGRLAERVEGFKDYRTLRDAITSAAGMVSPVVTPEELSFAVSVDWIDAIFKAAARPADDVFRRLWTASEHLRDRHAAAQKASAARGEIAADEAKRRIRLEEERHMAPLEPQLRAAMAEAKALRRDFVESIEEAVEIYAAARLSCMNVVQRPERASA